MTSLDHSNNLSFVTLHFPSSTPPSLSAASPSSPSSTGWTDKITKKIQEFKNKEESLKKLKEAKNGYLPEQDSKSLDSLPTQLTSLETMQKLAEFAEQVDTKNNKPTNILNNLCTGLETFLGFNPSSKGYTGQGIVYSDLDRLCDGVMGFLYQVLKDVSEKQPYSVGRETLKNLVSNEIKPKLCSGHEGFKKLFERLPAGIAAYNRDVRDSNDKVKKPIEEMIEYLKDSGTIAVELDKIPAESVSNDPQLTEAVKAAVILVDRCVKKGKEFTKNMRKVETQYKAISYLNSALRDKIDHAKLNVGHETAMLGRWSDKEKENLESTSKVITTTFMQLKLDVNKNVCANVTLLVGRLKDKVTDILKQLKRINEAFVSHVTQLGQWIDKAEQVIDAAVMRFNKLVSEVDGDVTKLPKRIEEAAEQIALQTVQLYNAGDAAISTVKENVSTALTKVKEMDEALKGDLFKVKKAVNTQVERIKEAIGELYKVVKEEAIGDGNWSQSITEFIKHMQRKVKDIKTAVGEKQTGDGVYQNWELLKGQIMWLVDKINGTGLSNFGLKKIVQDVERYFHIFSGKTAFQFLVNGWMKMTVNADRVVKYRLGEYHRNNQSEVRIGGLNKLQDQVTMQITRELSNVISQAQNHLNKIQNVDLNSKNRIEQLVNAVREGIELFVRELGSMTEKTAIQQYVDRVVSGIESQLRVASTNPGYDRSDLIAAVECALAAIHAIAKQNVQQLDKLLTDCHITNVDDAIDNAEKLRKQFDKYDNSQSLGPETTDYGFKIDTKLQLLYSQIDGLHNNLNTATDGSSGPNHAAAVDSAITEVTNELGRQLPEDSDRSSTHVKIPIDDKKFHGYRACVVQPMKNGDLTGISGEGSLPAAIGEIRTKVEEALSQIGEYRNSVEHQVGLVTTRLFDLCEVIRNRGRYTKEHLDALKNTYFREYNHNKPHEAKDSIKKIHNDLGVLRSKFLIDAIKLTEKFADEANRSEEQILRFITQNVDKEVNAAINTLAYQARKNYVSTIKLRIAQYVSKVYSELGDLPMKINGDLTIGFKGFMKTFEDGDSKPNMEHLNINKLVNVKDAKDVNVLSTALLGFFGPLNDYLYVEIERLQKENNEKKHPISDAKDIYSDRLKAMYAAFGDLLQHITGQNRYDHQVPGKLDDLEAALSKLKPQSFEQGNTPILDGVTDGLGKFVDEMRKAYIGTYDGAMPITWSDPLTSTLPDESIDGTKIALTIIYTLFHNLYPLIYSAARHWKTYTIQGDVSKSALREYMEEAGYDISNLITRHNSGMSVAILLKKGFDNHGDFNRDPNNFKLFDAYINHYEGRGVVSKLFGHLNNYYQVSHLANAQPSKPPCNVFQMLCWLCGLTYNQAYDELSITAFGNLFEHPEEEDAETDEDNPPLKVDDEDSLPAYPKNITSSRLRSALTEVCHESYNVLTAIVGHGHRDGIYASDFFHNLNLSYPRDPDKCLDLFADILRRLYDQLYFLLTQCSRTYSAVSWSDCWYGQGVGGSSWQCNDKLCLNQTGNQTCNQNTKQTCEQHPSCGLKSPLQSFLEDGLQGFLPHPLKMVGCGVKCSVTNHAGVSCRTPMGFGDISVTASHSHRGAHLQVVLNRFCGQHSSPLTKLCGYLTCLLQRPPQSLGDMFAFYYNFLDGWYESRDIKRQEHKKNAFEDAVTEANFKQPYRNLNVHSILRDSENNKHKKGHLLCVVGCNNDSAITCGRFMQPISQATWVVFASKNSSLYLSWIVYLTETFYNLLQKLYNECCNNCNKPGTKCYARTCYKNCLVPRTFTHHDKCKSIARCPHTRPTLSQYGFVCKSLSNLSGASGPSTKRTCKDLCNALQQLLSDKKADKAALAVFIYRTIPEFLFTIREPFIWLNVALWSLSLFYLICVMVGRLDVLHIKSHLHSPSSHRIAAQSLLAAGRVNKLGRVFYLQA